LFLEYRDEDGSGKPSDPTEARAKAQIASLIVEMLQTLPNMTDAEKLDTEVAVATLWALWRELPENFERISVIPGILTTTWNSTYFFIPAVTSSRFSEPQAE
jgi:hypothetical protein